jgi:hypothetical protein
LRTNAIDLEWWTICWTVGCWLWPKRQKVNGLLRLQWMLRHDWHEWVCAENVLIRDDDWNLKGDQKTLTSQFFYHIFPVHFERVNFRVYYNILILCFVCVCVCVCVCVWSAIDSAPGHNTNMRLVSLGPVWPEGVTSGKNFLENWPN